MMALQIVRTESLEQLDSIRGLWHEYMTWDAEVTTGLGIDANPLITFIYEGGQFQVPGEYASPDGCLLLALFDSQVAGCGAWRKIDESTCETKRMYVRPAFRGKRIGKSLLDFLIKDIQRQGFSRIVLETAAFMKEARELYASLGFQAIEPYYEIPDELKPITLFMELKLIGSEQRF